MLQGLNRLYGGAVRAVDGDIGGIEDFYFDDDTWTVRYLVVDTGKWLPGRHVLIPLWALQAPEWTQARIPVRLTRDEVKRSPDIDTHKPVSRAAEAAALSYYGYPYYWSGPALWGPMVSPGPIAAMPRPVRPPAPAENERDTHLRSCREVTGYHLRARDGEIGHVDDFVIDGETWRIDHLLADTSNWIGGRSILLSPTSIERISLPDRMIHVALTREALARQPEA